MSDEERTTKLPAPFSYIEVTYPYEWPGFDDGVSVMNTSTGNGSVMSATYLRALVAAIDSVEADR